MSRATYARKRITPESGQRGSRVYFKRDRTLPSINLSFPGNKHLVLVLFLRQIRGVISCSQILSVRLLAFVIWLSV